MAFIFKLASFFIGIVTGAVIGAKLYGTVSGDSGNWVLAAIIVIAVAAACGFLADKYRRRALLWLTTIGGAGLVLGGLGRVSLTTSPSCATRPSGGSRSSRSSRGRRSRWRAGWCSAGCSPSAWASRGRAEPPALSAEFLRETPGVSRKNSALSR
ncbi:hypothetical protein NKG05_03480 [Oerskovia sp. M15]